MNFSHMGTMRSKMSSNSLIGSRQGTFRQRNMTRGKSLDDGESSGFTTSNFSEDYGTKVNSRKQTPIVKKESVGSLMRRSVTRTGTSCDASIVEQTLPTKLDLERAKIKFQKHQSRKQEIITICEKRKQEVAVLQR